MTFKKGETPAGAQPFVKGQSGNPQGKPPGARRISTVLIERLEKTAPLDVQARKWAREFCKGLKRVTVADVAAARLLYEAIWEGESWAMKELLDRTEGKAMQVIDVTSQGEALMQPVAEAILKIYGTDEHST